MTEGKTPAGRKSGYYWVKFHREPDKWLVAYWDEHQAWWHTSELGACATDARWSTIGPRIPQPPEVNADDARSKALGELARRDVADGSYDTAYTGEE